MKKRVSIKDVAKRADVSYQTVSKVLNDKAHVLPETAERVWQAARHLGYRPHHNARNLRAQRSRMIGYSWVPEKPNQANHILDMFLTSMVEVAKAAGYHLLPFPYREGDDGVVGYRELIDTGRVDGFILSSMNYEDPRARFLLEQQFPFVAFGRSNPEMDFPYVDVDGASGLQLATEHLISQGHRRIAVLAWPEHSRVGDDRLQGYQAAMNAAGLPTDPDLIARGENNFERARDATGRWLTWDADRRPTGIVALTDIMAIGAIHAGQARSLTIGRDLAIVGFDDAPMAQYLWPPLTSVRQPTREAGRKCVELLVALIEGKELAARQVLLQPELIVRQSSSLIK
ncbi:MAG: LacI family DNA-binding transcriptional regulator [Chloroflexi bacterium]|nr:LacI family DNA-binding transcriptional regulator [Chloroflexota bacterium]